MTPFFMESARLQGGGGAGWGVAQPQTLPPRQISSPSSVGPGPGLGLMGGAQGDEASTGQKSEALELQLVSPFEDGN